MSTKTEAGTKDGCADVNRGGVTPLALAIQLKHFEMALTLLKAGANETYPSVLAAINSLTPEEVESFNRVLDSVSVEDK